MNLGYVTGSKEEMEEQTRKMAIEEFQFENGVEVTGEMDDATQAKLVKVYGS